MMAWSAWNRLSSHCHSEHDGGAQTENAEAGLSPLLSGIVVTVSKSCEFKPFNL